MVKPNKHEIEVIETAFDRPDEWDDLRVEQEAHLVEALEAVNNI